MSSFVIAKISHTNQFISVFLQKKKIELELFYSIQLNILLRYFLVNLNCDLMAAFLKILAFSLNELYISIGIAMNGLLSHPFLLHHSNCLIIGLWPSLQGHPRQTNLHWWGTIPGTTYHHPKETDPGAKTPARPTTAR